MSAPQADFTPGLFTKELAARYLSMSTREIDTLRSKGHLVAVGTGKNAYFLREELDRYRLSLAERSTKALA